MGGSFPRLDHAVNRTVNDNSSLGEVDNTVDTSPWFVHSDVPGHANFAYHLPQFVGVGLAVGALLVLVTACCC